MDKPFTTPEEIHCYTEYERLHNIILCSPEYMRIHEIINHTQSFYAEENINVRKAVAQHKQLVHTLHNRHINTLLLPSNEHYPEQVYTRDIAFVVGKKLFISKMNRKIRRGEETFLAQVLDSQGIAYHFIHSGSIEGGDVLVDNTKVWVGQSERTSLAAYEELQYCLPEFEIIAVPFHPKYLHLDCVFNIISPGEALVFPGAFETTQLDILRSNYSCLEVNAQEQFTLATNVLSIGNKHIISQPLNKNINAKLRRRGYTVIEVDISELIKSGGAFRCMTLPLN